MWSLVATAAVLVFLEGLASLVVAVRDAPALVQDGFATQRKLYLHDPDLGWRPTPGVRVEDCFGAGATLTINAQGHRGTAETTAEAPADRYRIAFLGDSFTMGYGVGDEQTFPHQASALVPQIESVNMGVSGYGLDQIYLAYVRDGEKVDADLVVCSVIEDDLRRTLTDRFAQRYDKPRLEVVGEEAFVRNVPVPDRGAPSNTALKLTAFAHRLSLARLLPEREAAASARTGAAEAWQSVAEFALRDLSIRCRNAGRAFVVVYLPTHDDVIKRTSSASRWLERFSLRHDVPFVDLTSAFDGCSAAERKQQFRLKEGDGHYTPEGNRRIARALLQQLSKRVPGFLTPARRAG